MWNKLFKSKSKSKLSSNNNASTSSSSQPEHYAPELDHTTTQLCGMVKNKSKFSSAFKSLSLRRNGSKHQNIHNIFPEANGDHSSRSDDNNEEHYHDYEDEKRHEQYIQAINTPVDLSIPEPPQNLELRPCPICARTFVPATLVKHINICEKMQTKKRKIFDSSRQRREGTELAAYLPKNFGLPQKQPEQTMRASPPKTIAAPAKKLNGVKTPTAERKEIVQNPIKDTPRPQLKRTMTQQNEPCPYCERCFGMKAFDRHVEWCREKALLNRNNASNNGNNVSVAKERLQARIQYKAPALKSKRQMNREKYSGSLSCGGSTNSLTSDLGTPLPRHRSHLNSMSSSMTSDSGHSDRYDPFMSAKRQLEELFSPTAAHASTPKPQPQAPLTPVMSKSVTSKISPINTNFRRTSSLRLPSKKLSKTLLIQKPVKSNIQRGLSDDGPISPCFLKSSEYDEIPIKSAFNAIKLNEKPMMRNTNSAQNRKNLKLDLKNTNLPAATENSLSKTDSLAVFLKYENDLNSSPLHISLTEKELKDKSNTLSKKSATKTVENLKENVYQIVEEKPNKILPEIKLIKKHPQKLIPIKLEPINLSLNTMRKPSVTLDSILNDKNKENAKKDADFIDPKLINLCDNLPVNVSKMNSDSDTSSSTIEIMKQETEPNDTNSRALSSRRSSISTTSSVNNNGSLTLKRQPKCTLDNILYDTSLELEKTDNKITELNEKKSEETESIFEDFDFEEFISSFEDDEQYPIFKDYKHVLLNRNNTNTNNTSSNNSTSNYNCQESSSNTNRIHNNVNRSNTENEQKQNGGSTIQNLPNINMNNNITIESGSVTSIVSSDNNNNMGRYEKAHEFDDLSPTEKELLKSVQELDRMCESSTSMYPVDSDEISSMEGYPMRRQAGSKFSADSAYGSSLSRQSPPDHHVNRRAYQRKGSQPDGYEVDILVEKRAPQLHRTRDNMSLSSSGSESSLPPIIATLKTQKMELHPHKDKMDKTAGQMSKFCHECGFRFSLSAAKFCMECGVRRIIIE